MYRALKRSSRLCWTTDCSAVLPEKIKAGKTVVFVLYQTLKLYQKLSKIFKLLVWLDYYKTIIS